MKIVNFLKSKIKAVLGFAALFALLSQLIFASVPSAAASSPKFNFVQGDAEFLRGANVTKNESVWKDPVTGDPCDEFRGIIYYHNGVEETFANNTKIKISIPSSTTSKSAKITASLSADNASMITDTVVDGQIIGQSGLTVNLTDEANLEFVPGSVRWFPNSNTSGGAGQVPVALPDGQTGNEIISANGINIGNIQGCWDYAGFVIFGFRAKAKEVHNPSFEISKTVRNVTDSETNFAKSNYAKPEDVLEYKINFTNVGNAASDVFIRDSIPSKTTFVDKSIVMTRNGKNENLSNLLVGEGQKITSVASGESITLLFKVKVNCDAKDKEVLVNSVTLDYCSVAISDTASTTISIKVVPATTPVPPKGHKLPVSGPFEAASAIFSTSLFSIYGYVKYRKYMALKEVKIISDLLSM